jgi:type IV pilus assembly protein PilB
MKFHKQKVGDILVEDGFLTRNQLTEALAACRKKGERLGKHLVGHGIVPKRALAIALAKQNRLGYLDFSVHEIDPDVIRIIPEEMARKYSCMPIDLMGKTLLMTFADPANLVIVDEMKIRSKMDIVPLISLKSDIDQAIEKYYGKGVEAMEEMIKDISEEDVQVIEAEQEDYQDMVEGIDDAPVIRLVNLIVSEAIRAGSSDIHIEPGERRLRVRYRIDGALKEMPPPPKRLQNAILSRLKIMSDLDISERRRPQDGRFKVVSNGKSVDFRVSSMPTIFGEKIVLRLLDKSNLMLNLQQLGFEKQQLQHFQKAIRRPYGLVLVTGPTGSGKSTTLYSALSTINDPKKNIITVEDPVEYQIDGINQVLARPDIGLTFADVLRTILRQDPDIVMIGEIRDLETVEICIRAALTGHLVFSTLHTNDAPSTITRLVNMGVEPFLITASVIIIVAQRLVRRICFNCREEYEPEVEILEELGLDKSRYEEPKFYRGRGCSDCQDTGYRGRVALYEVMQLDEALGKSIIQGESSSHIRHQAQKQGMQTLRQSGIQKVLEGQTTIEEVISVTFEG